MLNRAPYASDTLSTGGSGGGRASDALNAMGGGAGLARTVGWGTTLCSVAEEVTRLRLEPAGSAGSFGAEGVMVEASAIDPQLTARRLPPRLQCVTCSEPGHSLTCTTRLKAQGQCKGHLASCDIKNLFHRANLC
jgi:hypothetical protein